jgi:DNA repair photolyase
MDHAAWLNEEGDSPAQDKYQYFMRPEPKKDLGPIQVDYDKVTGRDMRWRWATIGMVRNAPEDEKRRVRVFLDPLPHIQIKDAKQLQGWYQSSDRAIPGQRSRPRPCYTDAMLTEPYGGYCTVGCAFCYINSGFRGYRGSGLISVPVDYGEQVAKQLDRMKTSGAGYFSSFTDPFLPLEDFYHNTQKGAEAFVERGLPVFFLSRLRYPEWAIELLKQNPYSYAQKSINTSSREDWKKLSPGAATLDEHLDDIRRLKSEGIYVSIQCNPINPGITSHEDICKLFDELSHAGVDHVIVKFVEAGYSWAPTMVERMIQRFGPERGTDFASLFVDNIGGQKTILESYRLNAHKIYSKKAAEVGMTYATCYEYEYERDEKGEITSKRGRSIGAKYLTADQCHGQRVPMFTRRELDQPFAEVEECPPSGCLTCASDNDDKPRCGSELFGSAKSLRMKDLKQSVYDS